MPPGKRSKEATWKESELKDTLKEINDERARDGKSRRKREDGDEKGKHESSQRRSEKDRDRDKDRNRRDQDDRKPRDDRDREKDRERKHRDDKERDSERRHRDDKDRDRERRHGDDKDKERERRRRDEKERDGDRKHRDDKDRDGERKHRDDKEKRDRDRDNKPRDEKRDRDDRERRHRDDKGDGERRKHRDDDKDRHRKDDRDDKRRDDDRDRKHRDDKDRERDRKHRDEKDKDRDRRHRDDKDRDRKHRDEEDKERRHRDDKDRERRHRDDDRDKKHRDEDKDRERRHRDDKDKHDDGDKRRRRDEEDRKHRDDKKERRDEEESDRRRKDREEEKSRSSKQKEESGNKGGSSKNKTDEPEEKIEAKRTKPVSAKPSKKEEEPEEDDYGGYDDDDFEDYDDDFEDDDGGEEPEEKFNKMGRAKNGNTNREMEDLFDALNEENDRLLSDSRKSNWSDSTEEERQGSNRPVTGKPRSFVNFVAAKQRDMNQKVANKARKRCTELLNIIELDTVHFTLFDLPPVKEYDLYMSSFGRTNAQQVYIQTNDDNLERDTQTEDIETADMWCQHPPEGARGCGGNTASIEGDNDKESAASKVDEGRLSLFLQRACQVVEKLINEENAKSSYTEKSAAFSCSEAYTGLRSVEVFQSRKVSRCHFSNTDSSMLLTMHTEPTKVIDKKLDKYGMIGVWNINDPSQPQKIVASASMPTCCCYSPVKATMVFGGMLDGSLVAWDLREPPTMHHSYMCGGQDWLLRFPTYNTAGVLKYENHNSPITAIVPILQDNKKSTAQESGTGLSFQLATLDKTGIINLWVVAEILETSMAGSESDLGLSPNGKIKLLKSSSITLNSPIKSDLGSSLCTLDLKLNTVNHNHLYIATDAGLIIHSTRFGSQKTVPRSYMSDDSTPCDVTSLDLHPFGHSVLLAGYEDGSVRLFHLSTELPIITWESSTNGAAVRRVLWSRSCAYIIFILDSNSIVHMWDLLRNDAEPMTSEQVMEKDSTLVDIALSEEEQSNARPKMVLSYEDGTIQVHLLSSHVSNLQPGENEQFSRFVEQL